MKTNVDAFGTNWIARAGARLVSLCAAVPLVVLTSTAHAQTATNTTDPLLQEITVSSRRVDESILTIPASVTVLGSAELQNLNVENFQDYALRIPNLAFNYGGGGNGYVNNVQISIRGISGSNTTGFYIDDTPVPLSLNPQIVDVARVEVLKGPQGTLYGSGSMGGNVRLVTQAPKFANDFSYALEGGYTDHAASPNYRASGVGNLDLLNDVIAVRAVGVVSHEGGFLKRQYSNPYPMNYTPDPSPLGCCTTRSNQGEVMTYGGSLTALFKISDQWSITAAVMAQSESDYGRRTQLAPLPEFVALDSYTVGRLSNYQEGAGVNWYLPSLTVAYNGEHFSVTSSTSYFNEHTADHEDGTEGNNDIVYQFFNVALPTPANGDDVTAVSNEYTFNEELRATINQIGPFRAIIGARYSRDFVNRTYHPLIMPGSDAAGVNSEPGTPTDFAWASSNNSAIIDKSIFGETYWRLGKFELTVGGRIFNLETQSNPNGTGYQDGWYGVGFYQKQFTGSSSEHGISPKAALAYQLNEDTLLYATTAKGFRPGGTQAPSSALCAAGLAQLGVSGDGGNYKSDSIWNYEIGGKTRVGSMLLTGAAFQMDWTNIIQSVIIPICGNTRTLNLGTARVRGAELEAAGTVLPGLTAHLGLGYQDAVILESFGILPPGSRIAQIPEVTGTLALSYEHPLSSTLAGFTGTDFSYTGNATSFTSGTAHVRRAYGLWNARAGVRRDRYELEFFVKNLLNSRKQLGDISNTDIVQLDPSGNQVPNVYLPPPITVGLRFSRTF
jgi:iron complex outermembrane receptor protein